MCIEAITHLPEGHPLDECDIGLGYVALCQLSKQIKGGDPRRDLVAPGLDRSVDTETTAENHQYPRFDPDTGRRNLARRCAQTRARCNMELDRITLEYERRIHMPEQSASRRCKRQHEQHDERRKESEH